MLWIETVVEREFFTARDIVQRIEDDSRLFFPEGANIRCGGMVDEPRFIATEQSIDSLSIAKFHEACEPDRIVEAAAAPGLFFRNQLSLVLNEALPPLDVFASKQPQAMYLRTSNK